MRVSISTKILGIALALLALMGGVAVIAGFTVARIAGNLAAISETYFPVADEIAEVQTKVLEEEKQFERLELLYAHAPDKSQAIDQVLGEFNRAAKLVDASLVKTRALIEDGASRAETPDAAAQFARTGALFEDIVRGHRDIEDHFRSVLPRGEVQGPEREGKTSENLEAKQSEYNAAVDRLRHEVAAFVQTASHKAHQDEQQLRTYIYILTAVAAMLGLVAAMITTAGISRPLRRLLAGLREVEQGRLDIEVRVRSRDEVGELSQGFNHMVGELRLKEVIRETFGQYVDPRISEGLLDNPELTKPGGERRDMTVLFSDIAGFTEISERLMPAALVKLVNAYFTQMSEPIREEMGIVDKYIGDAIMAFWGPPFVDEREHPLRCCRAALASLDLLESFQGSVPDITGIRVDAPHVDMRIGIATGPVVIGSVGSDVRMNYTIMGDTVNLAARLEGACKVYGLRVLISEETRQRVGGAIEAREIDLLTVKGKTEPVRVFQPIALAGGLDAEGIALVAHYEAGLNAYRKMDWDGAEAALRAALDVAPGDQPSRVLLDRVAHLRRHPPGTPWPGVWRLEEK